MRKQLSFLFATILFTNIAIAQQKEAERNNPSAFRFECRHLRIQVQQNLTTLLNVSSMKNDKLAINGASKVLFDKPKQEYLIYGCKEFTFDGKIVVTENSKLSNVLRYKIGDDILYIN